MKNDEKIDIQLEETKKDGLSDEEIAQKNYETALRYINIAEHMKQYEDQDKYYDRALKYLELALPYKDVSQMIQDIRHKKFFARATGKVVMYKEACKIRDNAKTPTDYDSARALFERIHKYETKQSINPEYISAELNEEVNKCNDSEQQAVYCTEMAEKLASKQKRHSLIASIVVIALIAAALLFSRTTAFHQCLGFAYAATGDYDSSWQEYYYVYEHTKNANAFEKYKANRYKTAVDAAKSNNTETIREHFRALAELDYKDSAERLVRMERTRVAEREPGEKIRFGAVNWRVVEHQNGKTLLIKDKAIGSTPYQADGKAVTWEDSSSRRWLNQEFVEETFSDLEQEAILDTTVIAEDNPVYHTDAGNDTTDKVFLFSCSEVEKYKDVLHDTQNCWWLRTPGAQKNSACFVYSDKTVMDYGYDVANSTIMIRPAIWVDTNVEEN